MSFKGNIKQLLPEGVVSQLRFIKLTITISFAYLRQGHRFIKYSSCSQRYTSIEQVRASMFFYVHRLEKGLSHTNFRPGFGESALKELASLLSIWQNRHYPETDPAFKAAVDVLAAYKIKHQQLHVPVPDFFEPRFTRFMKSNYSSPDFLISGVRTIHASDKASNSNLDFKDLFNHRSSIREFTADPVNMSLIEEAASIAAKTPSVCNRQCTRLTEILNSKVIKQVLDLQGGWRGYAPPPVLLLVTSDISGFVHIDERNEPFIDGGLYGMSLLMSLEYVGLGACPLNTMMNDQTVQSIKSILRIPDCEELILFIAVGCMPNTVLVPKSYRYPASDHVRQVRQPQR